MKHSTHAIVAAVLFAGVASADTLVRIDGSTAEEPVTARVVGDLRGLKPGDRFVVSAQDPSTGKRQLLSAEVRGTLREEPAADAPRSSLKKATTFVVTPQRSVVFREVGTAVELVEVDPSTRKVTVLGESGGEQAFYADEKAMRSLASIRPGETVFLSYRFNEAGKAEALVRTGRPVVRRGATVQVITADPVARRLVVRGPSGSHETFVVDDEALADLLDLKQGDTVLVGLRNEHVVVVTPKQ
jgi:hypothetical protein